MVQTREDQAALPIDIVYRRTQKAKAEGSFDLLKFLKLNIREFVKAMYTEGLNDG